MIEMQRPAPVPLSPAMTSERRITNPRSMSGEHTHPLNGEGRPQANERQDSQSWHSSTPRESSISEASRVTSDLGTRSPMTDLEKLQSQVESLAAQLQRLKTAPGIDEDGYERVKYNDVELSAEILRLPMNDYSPKDVLKRERLTTAFVAYYRKLLTTSNSYPDLGRPSSSVDLSTMTGISGSKIPERLQINSVLVTEVLDKLTGAKVAGVPVVMLPPYKALIIKRDEISDVIEAKAKSYDKHLRKSARGSQSSEVSSDEESDTDTVILGQRSLREDDATIRQLRCLLRFIDEDLKPIFDLRRRIERNEIRKIAFDDLWHLFNPGDLLFTASTTEPHNLPDAYRAFCITGGRAKIPNRAQKGEKAGRDANEIDTDPGRRLKLNVDCFFIGFDADSFGPEQKTICINPYDGSKAITDLDVYPARFHPKHNQILEKLRARGRRFRELLHTKFAIYEGLTATDPEEIYGEVVVDFKTGYQFNPRPELCSLTYTDPGNTDVFEVAPCRIPECTGCTFNYQDRRFDWSRNNEWTYHNGDMVRKVEVNEKDFPEHYYELLPKQVLGYYFKGRSWHYLDIDLIQDIDSIREKLGFEELVIEKAHKDLLRALVMNHSSGKGRNAGGADRGLDGAQSFRANMDLIRGKGRGLIILLHGAPGVGKTLTAETIAAYTQRSLYPITCGDLGQTTSEVERNLKHHFRLAHKWGCVLLLDEADVFLAKRRHGDIQRNGLVSVFLRELEYYSGIFFLTTNQVGIFDEAFKSRIHISLYYPPLSLENTHQLWKNHLLRIQRQNDKRKVKIKIETEEILDFAKKHYKKMLEKTGAVWNGRQVRNAFQTAIALAEFDRASEIKERGLTEEQAMHDKKLSKVKLKKDYFKKVSKASEFFDEYLKLVRHGDDEAASALRAGLRADKWSHDLRGDKGGHRFRRDHQRDMVPPLTPHSLPGISPPGLATRRRLESSGSTMMPDPSRWRDGVNGEAGAKHNKKKRDVSDSEDEGKPTEEPDSDTSDSESSDS